MKASRAVLLVALALLAIAALRDLARLGDALPWRQLYDFADFYCAGATLDRGEDPYRYEPLHRCEHSVNETAAYRADPGAGSCWHCRRRTIFHRSCARGAAKFRKCAHYRRDRHRD